MPVAIVNRAGRACLIEKARSEQGLEGNEGFSQGQEPPRQRQKLNLEA